MKTPTIEQIEAVLESKGHPIDYNGCKGLFDGEFNQVSEAIHAIIPDNSELIEFIQDDVLDALNDLQNYIDTGSWTRHQQAESEACNEMIEKAKKLIG